MHQRNNIFEWDLRIGFKKDVVNTVGSCRIDNIFNGKNTGRQAKIMLSLYA